MRFGMVGEPGIMKEKAELMPTITTQATFRGRSAAFIREKANTAARKGQDWMPTKPQMATKIAKLNTAKLVPNLLMSMRPSTTSEPVPIIQALNMPPNMKAINRLVQ